VSIENGSDKKLFELSEIQIVYHFTWIDGTVRIHSEYLLTQQLFIQTNIHQ